MRHGGRWGTRPRARAGSTVWRRPHVCGECGEACSRLLRTCCTPPALTDFLATDAPAADEEARLDDAAGAAGALERAADGGPFG